MRTVSCAILDDNQFSSDVLVSLIERISNLQIVGNYSNTEDARQGMLDQVPEILFIDMEMEGFKGFNLVSTLSEDVKPLIIAISGKSHRIFEAEMVGAIDFLLKPIMDFNRFQVSVERAMNHLKKKQEY